MARSGFLRNLVISGAMSVVTLAGAELLFRHALFSGWKVVAHLRDPGLYAKNYPDTTGVIFSQEYWLLYTLLGGERRPPEKPHPLLGWTGAFDRETLVHHDAANVRGKRPVLFYGDSFAECVFADCFQTILNGDTAFAKDHHLLNYGVGGYGVDQIHLLMTRTVDLYDRPFVVLSLMTRDLERSMLQARIGQKPFYTIEGDSLVLRNTPIDPDPLHWFKEHKPVVPSYLWRLMGHRVAGDTLLGPRETTAFNERLRQLNTRILQETFSTLRRKNIDFMVVVFEPLSERTADWRPLFMQELLEQEDVPYLFTFDLVRADGYHGGWYGRYEQTDNGHPTSHQNRLIASAVARFISDSTYREELSAFNRQRLRVRQRAHDRSTIEYWMEAISNDSTWYASIRAKAEEHGLPADSMLRVDADWMMHQPPQQ